jgi:hypothetical protein
VLGIVSYSFEFLLTATSMATVLKRLGDGVGGGEVDAFRGEEGEISDDGLGSMSWKV